MSDAAANDLEPTTAETPVTPVRRRGPLLVIGVCIVGCVAVLAATAVVLWPSVRREMFLRDLRATPETSLPLLMEPAGDERDDALRRFLDEDAGRAELFRRYLDEYDLCLYQTCKLDRSLTPSALQKHGCEHGFLLLSEGNYSLALMSGRRQRSSVSMMNKPQDAARRSAVFGALDRCVGKKLAHPKYPHLEFWLARTDGEKTATPHWWPPSISAPLALKHSKAAYICYFRKRPGIPDTPQQ